MKYFSWLWNNSRGIRWNTAVHIVTGIGQVVLGLMMVWLSKRFIDDTAMALLTPLMGQLASEIPFYHLKNLPNREVTDLTLETIMNDEM